MRQVHSGRIRVAGLVAWALVATACATTSGVAVPGPFPTAPVPAAPAPSATAPSAPPASKTPSGPPRVEAVMKTALAQQGVRYRAGGETPTSGFDCSGLVRYAFEQHQVEVPRTVTEQYQVGKKVAIEDIRKGDLLFFAITKKGPTHVGIAMGPASLGQFVHAPGSGGAVRVEHFDTAYWRSKLVGVRRVL